MRYLSSIFLALVTLMLVAQPAQAKGHVWEEVTLHKKKYVTVSSLKKFYRFQTLNTAGKSITLKNKIFEMQMKIGSQEFFMNKVKFILSLPVTKAKGRAIISQIDLIKLIDPVLRPNSIKSYRGFDTVIIDAGHGGKDPGAVNQYGTEAKYNLNVALMLRRYLKKKGFKVVMTRSDNRFLTLQQRVNLANRYKNAIFVSIHFNAGGAGKARGIETFTLSPKGVAHHGRSVRNSDHRVLRGNHQDSQNIALATACHWSSLDKLRIPDRGIKRARYSVLTTIKHPAILIEGGFMSHKYEARQIHNVQYQDKLAQGIASGIFKYRNALSKRKR